MREVLENVDIEGKTKPVCRGQIHRAAFYTCFFLGVILSFLAKVWPYTVAIVIYFTCQMITFGVSSLYHMGSYKSKKEIVLMQKIDHAGDLVSKKAAFILFCNFYVATYYKTVLFVF